MAGCELPSSVCLADCEVPLRLEVCHMLLCEGRKVVPCAKERRGWEFIGWVTGARYQLVHIVGQGPFSDPPFSSDKVFGYGSDLRECKLGKLEHVIRDLVVHDIELHLVDIRIENNVLLAIFCGPFQELVQVYPTDKVHDDKRA